MMRKYNRIFPYVETCNNKHTFEDFGDQQKCIFCKWIKHKEEIDAENEYKERMKRINERKIIASAHISLFHF
jgi:hypothetical protein